MISQAKKYQIELLGECYTFISDEPEAEILNAISYLNSLFGEIKSDSIDSKKIAILIALRLAKKVGSLESDCKKMKEIESRLIEKIDNELIHYSI